MKQPMNQPPGAPRHEHVPWSRRHFALAVPLLGGIGALGMLGAGLGAWVYAIHCNPSSCSV